MESIKNRLIETIREMPEQTRKLAMGASIFVAAIFTLVWLRADVTTQLANTADTDANTAPIEEAAPTPAQGIAESVVSLGELLPAPTETTPQDQGVTGTIARGTATMLDGFTRGFSLFWNYFEVK